MKYKITNIIAFLIISSNLFAQYANTTKATITQGNLNTTRDLDVGDSPYLSEDWMLGDIVMKDGTQFKNVKLKFDVNQNLFLYNRNDSAYLLNNEVTEVIIYDKLHENDSAYNLIFHRNLNITDKIKENNFVQVLANGKITLLKEYKKMIEGDNTTNGYNTTARRYILHIYTWVVMDNKTIPAKYTSKFLEELTTDKLSLVKDYINANNLKVKNEQDFIKVISYYNRLK